MLEGVVVMRVPPTSGGEGEAPSKAITRSNPLGEEDPPGAPTSSRLVSEPLLTSLSERSGLLPRGLLARGLLARGLLARGLLARGLWPRGLLVVAYLGLVRKRGRWEKGERRGRGRKQMGDMRKVKGQRVDQTQCQDRLLINWTVALSGLGLG